MDDDYETPIEELPGILGYSWDGEFVALSPEIEIFKVVDLKVYSEILEGLGSKRRFEVDFQSGKKFVEFSAFMDVGLIFEQVPGIDVQIDLGPPNAGPASGSGYLFFLKDDYNLSEVAFDILKLQEAFLKDISDLKQAP